jgi:hypothetical protein
LQQQPIICGIVDDENAHGFTILRRNWRNRNS